MYKIYFFGQNFPWLFSAQHACPCFRLPYRESQLVWKWAYLFFQLIKPSVYRNEISSHFGVLVLQPPSQLHLNIYFKLKLNLTKHFHCS